MSFALRRIRIRFLHAFPIEFVCPCGLASRRRLLESKNSFGFTIHIMILLIDNYDSFSYNLYQLIARQTPEVKVVRNDEVTISAIEELQPQAIVLSPGPGRPSEAGVCEQVVRHFLDKLPILGVCLGHQAICEALGGRITYASELMHGKKKQMRQVAANRLFAGLPETFDAARYHSLAAEESSLPAELVVTARSVDSEDIMAVEHERYPVFGLQFHPESVMTPDGDVMIRNFLRTIADAE